ncbi:MAG: hypothetical protein ABIU05_22960, partial [Nitrospirales bacterium]
GTEFRLVIRLESGLSLNSQFYYLESVMKTSIFVVVAPFILVGCASSSQLPNVLAVKDPIKASSAPTHYHSKIGGYTHHEPVVPDPWVQDTSPNNGGEQK